jgi:16S rRNA pseudouridine516 synthase
LKTTIRLDKMLAHMGYGTRSELKKLVKRGGVTLNGKLVKDSGVQVNPENDHVVVDGGHVVYREFVYLMMNKPPGVVSATEDARDRTVIDLLPAQYASFELFPVGRLDKDTEGLLLLTNDGKLSHNLLSPRKHVPKTYFAKIAGAVGEEDKAVFAQGVELDDGYVTMPAQLTIHKVVNISVDEDAFESEIELTIMEGKFHQVKRMFESVGKKVIYLQRIAMGPLLLDRDIKLGEVRELTDGELELFKGDAT